MAVLKFNGQFCRNGILVSKAWKLVKNCIEAGRLKVFEKDASVDCSLKETCLANKG